MSNLSMKSIKRNQGQVFGPGKLDASYSRQKEGEQKAARLPDIHSIDLVKDTKLGWEAHVEE